MIPEQPAPSTTPPTQEETRPVPENWGDNPLFAQSVRAFFRNVEELAKRYDGKWAAFHGDELIAIGRTKTGLWQDCLRRGLKNGEFAVLGIYPGASLEVDDTYWDAVEACDRENAAAPIDLPLQLPPQ